MGIRPWSRHPEPPGCGVRSVGAGGRFDAAHDAPDQARAKLYKAIGYALIGKTPTNEPDFTTLDETKARLAMEKLQRAHELFSQVGVKKDMERLERRIKAATGTD
jgi:hypothetical protein